MTDLRDKSANETPFDLLGPDGFDIANLFGDPTPDFDDVLLQGDPRPQEPNDFDGLMNDADPLIDTNALLPHHDLQYNHLSSDSLFPDALFPPDGIQGDQLPLMSRDAQAFTADTAGPSNLPVTFTYPPLNVDLGKGSVESSLPITLLATDGSNEGKPLLLPH